MGQYTTILTDTKEFQIHTGYDQCMQYRIDEKIEWEPDPNYPGDSIDGVYLATNSLDDKWPEDHWVIIRDKTVIAVEERVDDDYQYHHLVVKYGILPPPENLWTDAQWAEVAKRGARAEAERVRLHAEAFGTPRDEQPLLIASISAREYTRSVLKQNSLLRQILPPRPVEGNELDPV